MVIVTQFSEQETIDILTLAHGVGPATAKKIYREFGGQSVLQIEFAPDKVVKYADVPEELANSAGRYVQELRNKYAELTPEFVRLYSLFKGLGFAHDFVERFLDSEGESAYQLATGNPFSLVKFKGAGLTSCDKLFLQLGGKSDDPVRIAAYIDHRIDSKSSTWFEADELQSIVRDMGCRDVSESIQLMLDAGHLVQFENLFTKPVFDNWESTIAESVSVLLDAPPAWVDIPHFDTLSAEQNDAIGYATESNVGILCGGAGTGKTTCVAELVQYLRRRGRDVALVASTGAAACRAQNILGNLVTARTVHSFLRGRMGDNGVWKFGHNADDPVSCDVVLVDETSMLDLETSAALLSAIDPATTSILLIGDDHQLPSVSKGSVFRDLIAAEIPTGRLTTTHRNAGAIAETADAIRRRKRFRTPRYTGAAIGKLESNFQCVPCKDDKVDAVLAGLHEKLFAHGFESQQIQTISGTNVVRYGLNPFLRNLHNANGKSIACTDYRIGDRIVHTGRNTRTDAGVYIPKGQQAIIESDERTGIVLRLLGRGEERVSIDRETLRKKWELAYAITVHKAQGNEWPATIVIGSHRDRNFDFSWCYTALTRAQQICFVVGNVASLQRVATNEHTSTARTRLVEKIIGGAQ